MENIIHGIKTMLEYTVSSLSVYVMSWVKHQLLNGKVDMKLYYWLITNSYGQWYHRIERVDVEVMKGILLNHIDNWHSLLLPDLSDISEGKKQSLIIVDKWGAYTYQVEIPPYNDCRVSVVNSHSFRLVFRKDTDTDIYKWKFDRMAEVLKNHDNIDIRVTFSHKDDLPYIIMSLKDGGASIGHYIFNEDGTVSSIQRVFVNSVTDYSEPSLRTLYREYENIGNINALTRMFMLMSGTKNPNAILDVDISFILNMAFDCGVDVEFSHLSPVNALRQIEKQTQKK
jgi:hypothetical protein